MDRDRSFNFKLLVPPRVNAGQISAVRPQEVIENRDDLINSLQGYSEYFHKEQSTAFPSTNLVAPTKPPRQDFPKMKAVSPMEKIENYCNPGQLYSKLFSEVEKIKCWKVKVDSDTAQKERQLQENKRTIETQRKAIQELQFGNESLSIKLEEQITENEDLRNKNSATRDMCNILKETFDRTAEKMHFFESEREETHHLFMENTESIQKLITAFESLRIKAEAEQQEMQTVKDSLLYFEELKKKYEQQCHMTEEEVTRLQTGVKQKENELQKVLFDLHESQKHCKQLQETTTQQHELLKSSKTEQESLSQKLQTFEQRCKESEKSLEATTASLEQSKKEYTEIIQKKDLSLQDLIKVKNQQAEKLENIKATIDELQNSLSLKIQRVEELENKLMAATTEVEKTRTLIEDIMQQNAKKDEQIIILKDEMDITSKSFELMKSENNTRVVELTAELSSKSEEAKKFKNEAEVVLAENDLLKKACEAADKSNEDLKETFTIKVQELEAKLCTEREKNKEYTSQMEQLRNDITQYSLKYEEVLSNFYELQSEKVAIDQQFESGSSFVKLIEAEMKTKEKVMKLTKEIQRLEEENQALQEELTFIKTNIQGKCQESETLQKKIDENCKNLQKEITEKEKHIKAVEKKLCCLRKNIETKLKAKEEYQKENKLLKKQIAKEIAKSSQLESVISGLNEESQNLKRLNEEDHQKLLKDLTSKSAFIEELENEAQKLRLTAAEAIKNKEDAELKCQNKISDMVALMEKHKSQYDRMVEEKDAELQEKKKKEFDAVAHIKSLEFGLSKQKTENDNLKKQLKKEVTEKESLQKDITDLKKELSSMKINQLSEATYKPSDAWNFKQGKCSDAQKESSSSRHVFDFSRTRRTPNYSKDDGGIAVLEKKTYTFKECDTESIRTLCGTPWTKDMYSEGPKTPRSITNSVSSSSKIKRYADAPHCEANIFQKIQSPVTQKSPGNMLKLAAIKRIRDAGWTAVTGCDKKKKKKTNEKIFA